MDLGIYMSLKPGKIIEDSDMERDDVHGVTKLHQTKFDH